MNSKVHIADWESYDESLKLLLASGIVAHRKMIVECCVLASANLVNLALHSAGKVKEETDIKHNRLEGFLRRSQPFDDSIHAATLVRTLEDCKYKVVHGTSISELDVKRAVDTYGAIKELLAKNVPELKAEGGPRR